MAGSISRWSVMVGKIMPVKNRNLKSGKIRVTTPGGVKSKAATPENAEKQERLLNALDHGWEKPKKRKKKV